MHEVWIPTPASQTGTVVHTSNPSTQEAEEGLGVQGQPQLLLKNPGLQNEFLVYLLQPFPLKAQIGHVWIDTASTFPWGSKLPGGHLGDRASSGLEWTGKLRPRAAV